MVPNLLGVTENNKSLPLQNEFLFLSSSYLKGKFHHYKMSFDFNMFLSSSYWKGTPRRYKMNIGFYMCLLVFFGARDSGRGNVPMFFRANSRRDMKGFFGTTWDWNLACCCLKGNLLWYKMSLGFNVFLTCCLPKSKFQSYKMSFHSERSFNYRNAENA